MQVSVTLIEDLIIFVGIIIVLLLYSKDFHFRRLCNCEPRFKHVIGFVRGCVTFN